MTDGIFLSRLYDTADESYATARRRLLLAEKALIEQAEAVAAQRRALPPGPLVTEDYAFRSAPDGDVVHLSELFGEHQTLVVYAMMSGTDWAEPCTMCTMWVDGLDGVADQVSERTAIAVVTAAHVDQINDWAKRRTWHRLPLLSSLGTGFAADTGATDADGNPKPVVLVFTRGADGIRLSYHGTPGLEADGSGERGIDLLNPGWHVVDLLPQGRADWYPAFPDGSVRTADG